MADTDNKIQTAVQQLDPNNDNHWTTDGKPRIDTVKMLAADPSVTREAIDAAVPGFSRSTAADGTGTGTDGVGAPVQQDAPVPPPPPVPGTVVGLDADGKPNDDSQAEPKREGELELQDKHTSDDTTEPPVTSGDPTKGVGAPAAQEDASREAGLGDDSVNVATQAELGALDRGVGGDPDDVANMEEELADAVARTAHMREAVDHYSARLAESIADEDRLHAAIEAVRPRTGTMEAIQGFFAAQDADGERTIAVRKAVADSGIDLKELNKMVKPSALDQAMAGKK